MIVSSNNEEIPIYNNQITLDTLNKLFNFDFTNGVLLVYLDGKLIFNGTTKNDLTQIIYDMLKLLSDQHELSVEFTDENGKTNLSLKDVGGEVLFVSQFTLYANAEQGTKESSK